MTPADGFDPVTMLPAEPPVGDDCLGEPRRKVVGARVATAAGARRKGILARAFQPIPSTDKRIDVRFMLLFCSKTVWLWLSCG